MDELLEQIERANETGLYYVALFMALILPDICGSLIAGDGQAKGNRYARWVDDNVPNWRGSGAALYRFRCSLLHQGSALGKRGGPRLIFVEPSPDYLSIVHNSRVQWGPSADAYVIHVPYFVDEELSASRAWLHQVEGTQPFERNYAAFAHRHPNGIHPLLVGPPVIG